MTGLSPILTIHQCLHTSFETSHIMLPQILLPLSEIGVGILKDLPDPMLKILWI